jgi:acyl-CoA synthetase (AMP-forming)/AMP-acid ligase II
LSAARADLARGNFRPALEGEPARLCVSSGSLISGCEACVVDVSGHHLPDGHVGEICLRSVSMFEGYRNNPEKTSEVLKGGWYHSGDLGFTVDGEFFVVGRKKDIIIVAGKNLYPEDIEDAVGSVPDLLPGRVVAFGVDDVESGTEQVCVVAETTQSNLQNVKAIGQAIVEAGMRIDVSVGRVYLAPPRWLIKSSSGKPSRGANRERALAELVPVWK